MMVQDVAIATKPFMKNKLEHLQAIVLDELIAQEAVEYSLSNAIMLSTIEMPPHENGTDAFDAFINHLRTPFAQSGRPIANNDLVRFCIKMLQSQSISDEHIAQILHSVKQMEPNAMPLDVEQIWTSPLQRNAKLLVKLFEDGIVQTAENVYLRLREAPWIEREKVLAIWIGTADQRTIPHFPLLPLDITHVMSSAKLRKTTLFDTVMNNWQTYLDRQDIPKATRDKLETKIKERRRKTLDQMQR